MDGDVGCGSWMLNLVSLLSLPGSASPATGAAVGALSVLSLVGLGGRRRYVAARRCENPSRGFHCSPNTPPRNEFRVNLYVS
jgi:hypothetical protein